MIELYKKIGSVQKEIGTLSKEATNPFFKSKYLDLNDLLSNLSPLLQKQQLVLTQPIVGNKVYTMVRCLDTNDVVESSIELPSLTDPQKIGSCITYFRRYTLKSLFAIQEEDDDANKASGNKSETKSQITEWLSEKNYKEALNLTDISRLKKCLEIYNGKNGIGMKTDYRIGIEKRIKELEK